MQKLFIPYELAVLAKEKGFDDPCIAEYYKRNLTFYKNLDDSFKSELEAECDLLMTYTNSHPNHHDKENTYCAPLYQQLLDWFRKNHRIDIYHLPVVKLHDDCEDSYAFHIFSHKAGHCVNESSPRSPKYYNILNTAIEEAFKLI